MGPGFDSLLDVVQNEDESSSPSAGDATSSAPPPADNTKSSPPPPDSSSSPPPASSPPPPDSSPPPPASSPPPEKSKSPPPPKEDSPSAPPPKEESSPSPPPPKEESTPSPPTPDKSPSPEKSPEKSPPATPPPANSPPAPSGGTPPATIALQSPPPPGKQSAATSPPHPPAGKLNPPSGSGSHSSTVPPPSPSPSSVSAGAIAAVVVIGVGLLAAVIICLVCAVRKKKRKQYYMDAPGNGKGDYYGTSNWNTPQNNRPSPGLMGEPSNGFTNWSGPHGPPGPYSGEHSSGFSGQHQMGMSPNYALNNQSSFSYEELARATNGFSQENVIGQGGFGYVHKGVLPTGKEVAVKSLKSGSGQGDREFQAEVDIISRVHHRHLVSLVGYCVANGQRMLVYEFVPNKTMEFHLHGKGQPVMMWSTRMRIALGAAKGLAYLHEDCHPKIIHRDIKSANILLDFNFEAMVADFGLAKLTSDTSTHVSTRVMGTFGYMAPEYASSGKLTDKSDVFSFGVMLLELITGRKPIDLTNETMEDSLVDWARPLLGRALEDGNYGELVDPLLENNFDPHEMDRMIACAAASVRHSAKRRPKMAQIVRSLEGDHSSLDDVAVKPSQTQESSAYDTRAYNVDMMKFKKMVLTDTEASTEFEQTSDYGVHPSSSSSDVSSREFASSGPHTRKL